MTDQHLRNVIMSSQLLTRVKRQSECFDLSDHGMMLVSLQLGLAILEHIGPECPMIVLGDKPSYCFDVSEAIGKLPRRRWEYWRQVDGSNDD